MNQPPSVGFWKRTVAYIIDIIFISIPTTVVAVPLIIWGIFSIGKSDPADPSAAAILLVFGGVLLSGILQILSFWLYFAILESGPKQATYGKRWLGMKVVGHDGEKISFARATGRTFSKILSRMICYIGFIMAGTTKRKRALHDYIADTYVVKAEFQPGDEMPDGKGNPVLLIVLSVLLVGFYALSTLLSMIISTAATTSGGAM